MGAEAVTAVYDIGRFAHDGRAQSDYVRWLNATLRLPIQFTVFFDPNLDDSEVILKPGDELIKLPWSDLLLSSWEDQVSDICARRQDFKAPEDLTFRLPRYALLQFSKFDFLSRVSLKRPSEDVLLWIDAGMCRFFDYDFSETTLNEKLIKRLARVPTLAVDTTNLFSKAAKTKVNPGDFATSCKRLVSGGVFAVQAAATIKISQEIFDYVRSQWIAKGLWDNEQVALGEMILTGRLSAERVKLGGGPPHFLGALFPRKRRRFLSWL